MDFYVLESPGTVTAKAVTDFLPLESTKKGEAPKCIKCGQYIGMLPLLPPIRVELETWGDTFGDIAFGPGEELLASKRFWNLFQSLGLTGLVPVAPADVVKVKSHRKLIQEQPSYLCFRVVRSKAAIDEKKSGLVREGPWTCNECCIGGIIKSTERIVLERDSWSGEDIFIARGLPGRILASERMKTFCDQKTILNCYLIKASEFHFDHYA